MAIINNPSYFDEAMGGFEPQADADAAMKFALDAVFMTHRLGQLAEMIRPDTRVGGLEGEPGWSVEWDVAKAEVSAPGATVTARVEPEDYELAHPEFTISGPEFFDRVERIVAAYERRGPSQKAFSDVAAVKQALAAARAVVSRAA